MDAYEVVGGCPVVLALVDGPLDLYLDVLHLLQLGLVERKCLQPLVLFLVEFDLL